jgi:indole-3-glycerol phosphate synthase
MNIIQKIIAHKIKELSAANLERKDVLPKRLYKDRPSFITAIKKNPGQIMPNVIAEIKKASPSKGRLLQDGQITDIAKIYESSDASAISVLTDQKFFGGSLEDLKAITDTVNIPVIRKDFIFTKNQITEAANTGASAVLIMVTVMLLLVEQTPPSPLIEGEQKGIPTSLSLEQGELPKAEGIESKIPLQDKTTQLLKSLLDYAHSLGLDVLVETHSEAEIDIAVAAGAKIIGVNSRDFDDLSIDLSIFGQLLPKIPTGIVRVAESGIYNRSDILPFADLCDAILVGSSLMESGIDGIEEKLKYFTL